MTKITEDDAFESWWREYTRGWTMPIEDIEHAKRMARIGWDHSRSMAKRMAAVEREAEG